MRYKPIRYRQNRRPALWNGRRAEGPKTFDEQSGFPCYESDIIVDDYGTRVDARDTTYDRDKSEGEQSI